MSRAVVDAGIGFSSGTCPSACALLAAKMGVGGRETGRVCGRGGEKGSCPAPPASCWSGVSFFATTRDSSRAPTSVSIPSPPQYAPLADGSIGTNSFRFLRSTVNCSLFASAGRLAWRPLASGVQQDPRAVEQAVAGMGERVAFQHREPEDLRPGGAHHHEFMRLSWCSATWRKWLMMLRV